MANTLSPDSQRGGDGLQAMPPTRRYWPRGRTAKILAAIGIVVLALVLLLVFFPWDVLRGPINRYVSEQTGRRFEITRHLDVKLGRTTRVLLDGIEFANPEWAADPFLVKAESGEIHIRLWPLLSKRLDIPYLLLRKPELGLQDAGDGRRTWALDKSSSDEGSVPSIGLLQVDEGTLHFISAPQEADIRAGFSLKDGSGEVLPLTFEGKGTWRKQAFKAEGRTGSVLQIGSNAEAEQKPFPLEIAAAAGAARFSAKGSIGNLAQLDGIDAAVELRGRSLSELHDFIGVVLPSTPPYALKAQLKKNADTWDVAGMQGRLGSSDLSGNLRYAQPERGTPKLSGAVASKVLDFDDLSPLIGLQTEKQQAGVEPTDPATLAAARKAARAGRTRVLPDKALKFAMLKTMDADVRYRAAAVRHVQELPIERLQVHVQLANGALQLDPLDIGLAGGSVKGKIHVDSASKPSTVLVRLDGQSLQLNKLFPAVERMKASFGKLNARIDLQGRGDSVADMLATSSGSLGLLTGRGEFSNLLLEFVGLDGGEVIRLFVRGDKNVQLRCAAAAFEVKQGVMHSRTMLLDTADTVVNGEGTVSFKDEALNLKLRPQPKDPSILSIRSPLDITGTFANPRVFPDKGALAGRAALAVGLGLINPLLALAATIETGPGEDADCAQSLQQAGAVAKAKSPTAPAPASASTPSR